MLYLTLGTGLRPVPRSIRRAVITAFVYMGVAGALDWLLDLNYGLLRAKPDNFSILDFLAPWPWYLPELVVIGMVSILLYYAPFFVADVMAARRVSPRIAQSL